MNKGLIIRQLLIVFAIVFGGMYNSVFAQTVPVKPDTVYHDCFGCDSFQLSLDDGVLNLYSDTVIYVPHYVTIEGVIYESYWDVYLVSIGESYDVKDTLSVSVCSNKLPYYFNRNYFTESGDYWVDFPSVKGCDSAHVLFRFQVMEGQRDTVPVTICPSQASVRVDGIDFTESGVFVRYTGVDSVGCPNSKIYVVTRYPLVTDTIEATICQGYTYHYKGHSFDSTGVYEVPFTTETGCEGLTHLVLTVLPANTQYQVVEDTVCVAELPYEFMGKSFNHPGTFTVSLKNQYGCDSLVVNLYLSVTQPQVDTVIRHLCPEEFPYVYDSLHTYAAPGQYYINDYPGQSCTQFTLVMLVQNPVVRDTVTICTSDSSYTFGDTTFTQSTYYTYVDTNANHCLDYHTLCVNLNLQMVFDTVDASICASELPYMFYGQACKRSGNYTHVLQGQTGCDSATVLLRLTVKPNFEIAVYDTITRNDLPYVYRGQTYTQSGDYHIAAPAATDLECDSTYVLYLEVLPIYTTLMDTTVCANVPVAFLDDTITAAGTYQYTYHLSGYDSVIILNVNHYPVYRAETLYAEVGEYELPYHFLDSLFYTAGYHELALSTVNGCDSIFSLFLTINEAVENLDTIQKEICSNDLPLLLFDSILNQAGLYRYIVPSSTPAVDSVFYVNLTVKESPTLVIADTAYLCAGSTVKLEAQSTGSVYLWNNGSTESSIVVTLPELYSVTVSNAFECSTSKNVQVIQVALPDANIQGGNNVCQGNSLSLIATGGSSYLWNDGSVSDTLVVTPETNTTYYVTVTNIYGCSRSKDIAVTVNSLPELTIVGDNSVCAGESTIFMVYGADSYRWNTGGRTDHITASTAGVYSVTGTDENQCQSTATVLLEVHPLPTIKINGRTTFCQSGYTTITATGASTYEWNSGDMSQSITATHAGSYTVTGTDQYGCSATKSVVVTTSVVNASFLGNRSICPGQSTTLMITGDEGNTYRWFDGSNGQSIEVSSAGTYSVTVTNADGCQNNMIANVTELTAPNANITGDYSICEGQSTTLRASGGNSYLWDDGSTQPGITVNMSGTYSVTVTNLQGCTSSTSFTVEAHPAPVVTILAQDAICRGESVSITAISSANRFSWNTGQNSATIQVSPNTNTNYSVLVTDEHECTATATTSVMVNPLPLAYISGQSSICQGDTATLTASGGVDYLWSTGQHTSTLQVTEGAPYSVVVTDANGCSVSLQKDVVVNSLPVASVNDLSEICQGQEAVLTVNAPMGCTYLWSTGSQMSQISVHDPGVYDVIVTNANECSRMYHATVIVHEVPQINITGASEICDGQSALLTASATGALQYEWNNGDHNPSIVVRSQDQYQVTVTNAYGCSATASRNVAVRPLPEPQISGAQPICVGGSATLVASGGFSYVWSTGNTGSQLTVSPSSNQSYTVTASNTYGCMASTSATVVVNQLPQITISGNTSVCEGVITAITASGASDYSWSTGESTASINVSQPGLYKVTASTNGCATVDSVYVTSKPNPQVQIIGNSHVCAGSVSLLTATGAESYLWSTTENSASISIMPTVSTLYSVTGVGANGCSSEAQMMVNVETLPQAQIIGDLTICQGESTVLTATGGAAYRWSNNVLTQDIVVSPNINTSYTVTAYSEYGCEGTTTAVVVVSMLPSIFFSGNASVCDGSSATITVSGGSSYQWSNGITGNSITVSDPGYYKVTATNTMGCSRTDSINVVVWTNPVVQVNGDNLICEGATAVLTATGADSYLWSTGETGASIVVMPEETTTYSVIGYDAHNCNTTVGKVVNVEDNPAVYISGDLAICHGQSTTLTASDAQSYLWSTGDTTASITVSTQGAYTVTATSVHGCQSMASVTVIDNPIPEFTLHKVYRICDSTTEELSVSGNNTYLWSTGSTDMAITISTGGEYSVTATNNYGCELSDTVNVTQLPAPMLTIFGDRELCQGNSTTLMALSNATQFLWSTGDSTSSVTVTPDNTLYTVTVTAVNGCSTVGEHMVTTLPTYNVAITGSICEHQGYDEDGFNIPTIDSAGVYTFTQTLQTESGCDSIVNLMLTVNPFPRMDTIKGTQNITQHGSFVYSVNNPEYVNNYEWRVTHTQWTIADPYQQYITMNVPVNGTATLYARGVNGCGYTEISLNLTCNVGIEDHPTQTMVKLYPNPVHQSLFIDMDEAAEVAKVALFDEAGRLVYKTDCSDTHLEIDCTRFANGHYTVQFIDKQGRRVESRKIVVKN